MTDWACAGERGRALGNFRAAKEQASVAGTNRCRFSTDGLWPAEEAYPLQFGERAIRFVFLGRNAGQQKRPSGLSRRAFVRRDQYGASVDPAPASLLGPAVGTSASARLSLRTE